MKILLTSFFILITCLSSLPAQNTYPGLHQNDVILFQGDSITDGGRQRTGSDYNHIMGQDYGYIIAAKLGADFPERNLTFINRGISGNATPDLAARWQIDTLDLKPNVLSILIGVNDTLYKSVPADQYEQIYDKLLSDTLAVLPNVKIILGEPFLLPVGKHQDLYATELAEIKQRQDIVIKLGQKYKLPVIDYQKAFDAACLKAPPEHWSWDGVHPTYAGHGLMTEEWLAAVQKAWPNG